MFPIVKLLFSVKSLLDVSRVCVTPHVFSSPGSGVRVQAVLRGEHGGRQLARHLGQHTRQLHRHCSLHGECLNETRA